MGLLPVLLPLLGLLLLVLVFLVLLMVSTCWFWCADGVVAGVAGIGIVGVDSVIVDDAGVVVVINVNVDELHPYSVCVITIDAQCVDAIYTAHTWLVQAARCNTRAPSELLHVPALC